VPCRREIFLVQCCIAIKQEGGRCSVSICNSDDLASSESTTGGFSLRYISSFPDPSSGISASFVEKYLVGRMSEDI